MDSLPDFFFSSFFYLKVRSARELDRGTEYLALPPPRVSSCNGPKSTGVTVWRGNTICVITLAVFMGDGIINKPPPTTNPPYTSRHPPHSPRPSSPLLLSSPLALLPPHHHCTIHAYLNHTRPIKKKKEKKRGKKRESPDASPDNYSIISSCHRGNYRSGGPCAGRTCRPERGGLSWGREGKEWERDSGGRVYACVRACVCVEGGRWGCGWGGVVYKMEIYDRETVASFSLRTGYN